ncbi:hypothetical protein Bca4012_020717 [Brassica carinata]
MKDKLVNLDPRNTICRKGRIVLSNISRNKIQLFNSVVYVLECYKPVAVACNPQNVSKSLCIFKAILNFFHILKPESSRSSCRRKLCWIQR